MGNNMGNVGKVMDKLVRFHILMKAWLSLGLKLNMSCLEIQLKLKLGSIVLVSSFALLWSAPAALATTNTVTVTNSAVVTYIETSSDSLPVGLKKSKYKFTWAKNDCINEMTNGQWKFSAFVEYASGLISKSVKTKTSSTVTDYRWEVDEFGEDNVVFTVTCKQTAKLKLTKSSNYFTFCFTGSNCSFAYTKDYLAENNWKVRIVNLVDEGKVLRISPLPDPTLYDAQEIENMRGYYF